MISVVVPTMWKYKPFYQFLFDMLDVASIGEIIIIDNAPEDRPDLNFVSNPKIKVFTFGKNIFVNPAWNFGVSIAENDIICLLNDDVIVDLKIFGRVNKFITPDIGLCAICPGNSQGQILISTGEIDFAHLQGTYDPHFNFGTGTLMFFHKSNYTPIIDGLNLYWGDNFIYDTMFYKLNRNYHIINAFFYTPYAATCSTISDRDQISEREQQIYNREMPAIFEKIRLENAYRTGFY